MAAGIGWARTRSTSGSGDRSDDPRFLRKGFLKHLPSPMESRAHGSDRTFQYSADLLIGEVFHEKQRRHYSILIWQSLDGIDHAFGPQLIEELGGGIRSGRGEASLCRAGKEVEVVGIVQIRRHRPALLPGPL